LFTVWTVYLLGYLVVSRLICIVSYDRSSRFVNVTMYGWLCIFYYFELLLLLGTADEKKLIIWVKSTWNDW